MSFIRNFFKSAVEKRALTILKKYQAAEVLFLEENSSYPAIITSYSLIKLQSNYQVIIHQNNLLNRSSKERSFEMDKQSYEAIDKKITQYFGELEADSRMAKDGVTYYFVTANVDASKYVAVRNPDKETIAGNLIAEIKFLNQ